MGRPLSSRGGTPVGGSSHSRRTLQRQRWVASLEQISPLPPPYVCISLTSPVAELCYVCTQVKEKKNKDSH
jgi:hypothetical protein